MKNRKLVYLLAFILTLTLVVPALGQDEPAPEPPGTNATSLALEAVTTSTGADFTATAVLEDDEGTKLEGQVLEFSFGKDTDDDGQLENVIRPGETVTTDASGYAEYTFTAPSSSGDYDYRVYFASTENYDYTMDTAAVTVTGAEVRIKPAPKADTINHPACGYCDRQPLDKSSRFRPDGQSYTFIHTPNRIRR